MIFENRAKNSKKQNPKNMHRILSKNNFVILQKRLTHDLKNTILKVKQFSKVLSLKHNTKNFDAKFTHSKNLTTLLHKKIEFSRIAKLDESSFKQPNLTEKKLS